jgi:hypothetical protein
MLNGPAPVQSPPPPSDPPPPAEAGPQPASWNPSLPQRGEPPAEAALPEAEVAGEGQAITLTPAEAAAYARAVESAARGSERAAKWLWKREIYRRWAAANPEAEFSDFLGDVSVMLAEMQQGEAAAPG